MTSRKSFSRRCAFTLVEMLVVLGIIFMLVMLLLPQTRRATGAARRSVCSNQLRGINLAMLNYESAHGHLPVSTGAFDEELEFEDARFRRLSGLITLLPYTMEDVALWEQISNPSEIDGVSYQEMGGAAWDLKYRPWAQQPGLYLCPSSPSPKGKFGMTNYAFCIGDSPTDIHSPQSTRGAFGCQQKRTLDEVSDGTSKTIGIAEIGTMSDRLQVGQFAVNQSSDLLANPSLCLGLTKNDRYRKTISLSHEGRGGRWSDGSAGYTLMQTILPPNSPSFSVGGQDGMDGIYSAGSYHEGDVVMVGMLDGSARVITADIDVGDLARQPPSSLTDHESAESPFGIWGAMGTAASRDTIDASF